MSDLEVRVNIKLPINVTRYAPGRAATRWEPAEHDELEFTIDAPIEVADWIMANLDNDALQEIETTAIERADDYHAAMLGELAESREER